MKLFILLLLTSLSAALYAGPSQAKGSWGGFVSASYIDVSANNYYGYNSGDTIYINKPARFTVGTTADITSSIQDVVEEKVALVLDIRKVIAVSLTSADILCSPDGMCQLNSLFIKSGFAK